MTINREAIDQVVEEATKRITEQLGQTLPKDAPVSKSETRRRASLASEVSRAAVAPSSAARRTQVLACPHDHTYAGMLGLRCSDCKTYVS